MNTPIRQIPQPPSFGSRGMSAALGITEAEFVKAYLDDQVGPPDVLLGTEPRWSALALGREVKKRIPQGLGLEAIGISVQALRRAEIAEGWQ